MKTKKLIGILLMILTGILVIGVLKVNIWHYIIITALTLISYEIGNLP